MDFLERLNSQQRQAVEVGDGPVVIIAGPGTGKTKTLVARIAYLLAEQRAKPEQILALTFTKKAAEEMQARLGEPAVRVATFHALCHELLGGQRQFATEQQRLSSIKSLTKPDKFKRFSSRELALAISRAKNTLGECEAELRSLVEAYNATLATLQLIDFDDLLVLAKTVLEEDTALRGQVQARYRCILVDEFQDTNNLQYELLHLLRGNDNLFVIGDPNQSIYGFRGASGDIFARFKHDFPLHQAINLAVNYRSAPEVVKLSNALFGDHLSAHQSITGSVRAIQVLNEYSEASWILAEIQQQIGGSDLLKVISDDDRHTHRQLSDFAILYRSRSVATAVKRALAESGLPYQIVGDGSPYDDPHIQTLLGLLTACASNQPAQCGDITPAQCQGLLEQVDRQAAPSDLAETFISLCGFDKTPLINQFLGTLVRFPSLEAALQYFSTLADQQFYDPEAQAITLLTIHAAKGLEFPHVFLIAVEEGYLPHDSAELAEEKRLFYVAATRAKERLDILHATTRAGSPTKPSRFITILPNHILPSSKDPNLAADKRRLQKRQLKRAQTSLF